MLRSAAVPATSPSLSSFVSRFFSLLSTAVSSGVLALLPTSRAITQFPLLVTAAAVRRALCPAGLARSRTLRLASSPLAADPHAPLFRCHAPGSVCSLRFRSPSPPGAASTRVSLYYALLARAPTPRFRPLCAPLSALSKTVRLFFRALPLLRLCVCRCGRGPLTLAVLVSPSVDLGVLRLDPSARPCAVFSVAAPPHAATLLAPVSFFSSAVVSSALVRSDWGRGRCCSHGLLRRALCTPSRHSSSRVTTLVHVFVRVGEPSARARSSPRFLHLIYRSLPWSPSRGLALSRS
ncbi:hypothetical protein Tco_1244310 [Tanacetum coccineum]